jgi:glycosyltransferase involved in cell wall biosynthesis
MNVLHLIDSFEQGGTERQAVQLVRLLRESGHCNVRLACLQNKGLLRAEADRLGLGEIPEFPLTSFYDRNFVKQIRRLMHFLKENEIDVVHAHCFYTNIFGMIAATLVRTPARLTYKGETDGFRSPTQKRVERVSFRLAHHVIANSEAVRQQLIREGVPPDKIIQHYNGLDVQRVAVRPGLQRPEALSMLGLPGDESSAPARKYISLVANLRHPVKDHPMFLKAAAQVHAAIPEAAFVIAGEGELMPELKELTAQMGLTQDVFFIGRCEKVPELLFVSDLCALSSKAEGFSNAILEYMAAGRPAVVTDVGGAREAEVEGETGYVVPSGDHVLMAERMIELLRNPDRAHAMGESARQRVIEKFSSERHMETSVALYEELLGRRKTVRDLGPMSNVQSTL